MEQEIYSPNLKKIREILGLSVAKLAKKLDIPASTLTQYERGVRTPSFQLFAQLNKKLDVNLNWFVTGNGEIFNTQNKNTNDTLVLRVEKIEEILNRKGLLD